MQMLLTISKMATKHLLQGVVDIVQDHGRFHVLYKESLQYLGKSKQKRDNRCISEIMIHGTWLAKTVSAVTSPHLCTKRFAFC
jgi:hypothetical protein